MKDEAEDRAEGALPLPLRVAERTDGLELADETDGDDCEGVSVRSCPNFGEACVSKDEEEVLVRLGKAFRSGRSAW